MIFDSCPEPDSDSESPELTRRDARPRVSSSTFFLARSFFTHI